MAAGKTYDVMINAPAAGAPALPVYDRELSLSGNATGRDAGMLAYIGINGAGLPTSSSIGAAVANRIRMWRWFRGRLSPFPIRAKVSSRTTSTSTESRC